VGSILVSKKPTYEELEHKIKVLEKQIAGHQQAKERTDELLNINKQLRQEIIERQEAQEQLALFHQFVEASREGMGWTDLNGRVRYINSSLARMFGEKKPEDSYGRSVLEYYSEETQRRLQEEIFPTVLREGSWMGELVIHSSTGSLIPTTNSLIVLRDAEGNPSSFANVLTDLTERKRAEEEKKRLEAQLVRAQKMESIGTLAGGVAHDFNNLLMGIQGNLSLITMDIDSTHPYYERLKNIEQQIQSGARLTSHLLGYARKGRYEVKPIDLNRMLREASETFGRTRKEITIHRELAEDLFAIEADPGQIEQLLLNLYVNAADAMPGGGDLILKTANVTHKEMKGKLYDPKPGKYVLLTVTDTGIGMDKETMGRIFDPFFTTKEMGRGTGLGLASAYGIIKGHGGYIDVDSKKGQGTTFSIYLPASERKVQEAVKAAEPFIKGTGTILLVDDEEVIVEVGKELLEGMGYRVLTAKDGKEAIEVYEKDPNEIDIVILDMVMPNMGGGEAYDRMKEINPDVKVLLSSGFSIDGEASEILERGCNGFIQKPFNMRDLSEKIGEILDKK
jgi:two-component system cell cycle sensor histidine kinase/response regulator CckA